MEGARSASSKYFLFPFLWLFAGSSAASSGLRIVASNESVVWNGSLRICEQFHGRPLAGIEERGVNDYMKAKNIKFFWLKYKTEISNFAWINGIPFINKREELSQVLGDCVIWRDGSLQALPCGSERYFICKFQRSGNHTCSKKKSVWKVAKMLCERQGGHLVVDPTFLHDDLDWVDYNCGDQKNQNKAGHVGVWLGLRRRRKIVTASNELQLPHAGKDRTKDCLPRDKDAEKQTVLCMMMEQGEVKGECRQVPCDESYQVACLVEVTLASSDSNHTELIQKVPNYTELIQKVSVQGSRDNPSSLMRPMLLGLGAAVGATGTIVVSIGLILCGLMRRRRKGRKVASPDSETTSTSLDIPERPSRRKSTDTDDMYSSADTPWDSDRSAIYENKGLEATPSPRRPNRLDRTGENGLLDVPILARQSSHRSSLPDTTMLACQSVAREKVNNPKFATIQYRNMEKGRTQFAHESTTVLMDTCDAKGKYMNLSCDR